MTYEEYLDEVTTIIAEKYKLTDKKAITLVMRAQAADFFVAHDKDEKLRTEEGAYKDAKILFESISVK